MKCRVTVNVASGSKLYPYGTQEKLKPGVSTVSVVVKLTGAFALAVAENASDRRAKLNNASNLRIVTLFLPPGCSQGRGHRFRLPSVENSHRSLSDCQTAPSDGSTARASYPWDG